MSNKLPSVSTIIIDDSASRSCADKGKQLIQAILNVKKHEQEMKKAVWKMFTDEIEEVVRLEKIHTMIIYLTDVYPQESNGKSLYTISGFAEFATETVEFNIGNFVAWYNVEDKKWDKITNGMLSSVQIK